MFYRFMQRLLRLALRVYFRKIYLAGMEYIAVDKPVILACNHPNSFLDAVLLAVLVQEPIHFLARSDVFNTPLKKWLLHQFNLIPIYRVQEGAGDLHRNAETFARCYRILADRGKVLIFSEGICVQEKRLRPLKKGTARLAFGAEANFNFNLNLQVVPVGINYTHQAQFRKEVMISMEAPIEVNGFARLYAEQPARAILALNKRIETGLRKSMIIVEPKEAEAMMERHLDWYRRQSVDFNQNTWLVRSNSWLREEQRLVQALLQTERVTTRPPQHKATAVANEAARITMGNFYKSLPLRQRLIVLLGFPFYLLSCLLNMLPLRLAQYVTHRQVKFIEFYSSVLLITGMVFYLLYWLGLTITAFYFSFITGLLLFLIIPLSGYFLLRCYDYRQNQARLMQVKNAVRENIPDLSAVK